MKTIEGVLTSLHQAANALKYPISPGIGEASFTFMGKRIKLSGRDSVGLAAQTFFDGFQDGFHVSGKTVIDIGASIGDTAILYALRDAEKIIAYEPFPSTYASLLKNIESNGFSGKIIPKREAAGKSELLLLEDNGSERSSAVAQSSENGGIKTKSCSLGEIITDNGLKSGCAMKIDCEGCEFELLRGATNKELAVFDEIIMEIHGNPEPVEKKLREAGFSIRTTNKGVLLATRRTK
jgi:FkbM family methyltransferase